MYLRIFSNTLILYNTLLGTCVAIAFDDKSEDAIWFLKVREVNQSSKDNGTDDYYNIFSKTAIFFTGRFLKCINSANK